jgi:hypothetical protein
VDIADADLSRGGAAGENWSGVHSVAGIDRFQTITYDLEEGMIGRLEFYLSGKFETSSYREGNVVFVEMTRVKTPTSETGLSTPVIEQRPERVGNASKPSWTTYGLLDISIMNFKAEGVPDGSARAFGLMMVGGVRIGEYFSFEGGLNWFPIGAEIPLPVPLMWMPSDGGIYLNVVGGVRLNLVQYSTNKTVPLVSAWSVGHAVISDFSVGGSGTTYGIGVDIKGDDGKVTQLALRFHRFDGDLTIYDDYWDFDYPDQEIKAVELVIGFGKK